MFAENHIKITTAERTLIKRYIFILSRRRIYGGRMLYTNSSALSFINGCVTFYWLLTMRPLQLNCHDQTDTRS